MRKKDSIKPTSLESIQYKFNILKGNNNFSNWDSNYEAKIKSKTLPLIYRKNWSKNNRTLNKVLVLYLGLSW